MNKFYVSNDPKYVIPDQYQNWPDMLPITGKTIEEAMSNAMDALIAEDTQTTVLRLLDEAEICAYREDYTNLMEQDKIECEARLSLLKEDEAKIKAAIKRELDNMASIMQRVNDNVRLIRDKSIEEQLSRDRSIRVAVDGHYLFYTYVQAHDCFCLAKVCPIPNDDNTILSRQTKNQEVFISMFGVDFSPVNSFEIVNVDQLREELDKASRPVARLAVTVIKDDVQLAARDELVDKDMLQRFIDAGISGVIVYTKRDAEVNA